MQAFRFKMTILIAAAAVLAACAPGKTVRSTSSTMSAAALTGGPVNPVPAGLPESDDQEPDVRGSLVHSVPELRPIPFGYDSALLSTEARAVLDANAGWLKTHPELTVQVAGHCDQRGTAAYNIALGQKRANAVRDYYRRLGVLGNRVATITYGKERPICAQETETCWARNRRGETELVLPRDIGRRPSKRRS